MPETYSAHESRLYYVDEAAFGQTPNKPYHARRLKRKVWSQQLTQQHQSPRHRQQRFANHQTRQPRSQPQSHLPLPSESPINFLQYAPNRT